MRPNDYALFVCKNFKCTLYKNSRTRCILWKSYSNFWFALSIRDFDLNLTFCTISSSKISISGFLFEYMIRTHTRSYKVFYIIETHSQKENTLFPSKDLVCIYIFSLTFPNFELGLCKNTLRNRDLIPQTYRYYQIKYKNRDTSVTKDVSDMIGRHPCLVDPQNRIRRISFATQCYCLASWQQF